MGVNLRQQHRASHLPLIGHAFWAHADGLLFLPLTCLLPPLQLTNEFVELMDGPRSPLFKRFRELCVKTYMELRRQRHKVILLVEMVANGNEHLPCFGGKPQVSPTQSLSVYRHIT